MSKLAVKNCKCFAMFQIMGANANPSCIQFRILKKFIWKFFGLKNVNSILGKKNSIKIGNKIMFLILVYGGGY